MAFISLKNLLIKGAARFKSKNEAVLLSVRDAWVSISSEYSFSDSTKAQAFSRGILTISCSSSAEASHLRLQKQKIKRKINNLLNKEQVTDINFLIGFTDKN